MNNSHDSQRQFSELTPEAFLSLGAPGLAYVRQVTTPEGIGWGIFAADGNPMGIVGARDLAFAAARQHELEPVSVH